MSIGIAYNPCKSCKEMDKCSICELTYYRKGCIKSPASDVAEVRHGEWKKLYDKAPRYVCTACNHLYNNREYKFCPNCGADMRGTNDGKE